MAAEKVSKKMMREVVRVKSRYHLSISQCCRYLESEYGIQVSRTRMYQRLNSA